MTGYEYAGGISLLFRTSMKMVLGFVWVVQIDLILVRGKEFDFILVRG